MNKSLIKFQSNNPTVTIDEETEHFNLKKLWLDETFMVRLNNSSDFKPLEDIELPIQLCAIFHKKKQTLEFIFGALTPEENYLQRKTTFYYKGIEFKTEYATPSKALNLIAKGFQEIQDEGVERYRNLRQFRDFYHPKTWTAWKKRYFHGRQLYCFTVTGDFSKIQNDFVQLCKHLNIYLNYFDRESPYIIIINKSDTATNENYQIPCKTQEQPFPGQIALHPVDPIILDLLGTALTTGSNRLKYQFYFQVLEFFSYYHLDDDLRRTINNIIRNPSILEDSGSYSRQIIEELRNYSNTTTEQQKVEKLICDYVTIGDIKNEIQINLDYFLQDTEFDGKFMLPALIDNKEEFSKLTEDDGDSKKSKDRLRKDFLIKVADRIEKIRNVLVHIREKRENKVIFPTKNNHKKLEPYIYILQRIAETIAIKYDS